MDRVGDRIGRGGMALVVLASLAYAAAALVSGLDRIGANSPVIASALPPALSAQSLRNQAMSAQSIGDDKNALKLAMMAVRRTPVEPSSAAVLGAALLGRNDEDRADAVFRVAAEMGWRVPLTQLYWLQRSLDVGDFANAAVRVDALLRQDPSLLANRALLIPFETTAEGQQALADRLVESPDWLAPYVADVREVPADVLGLRAGVLIAYAGKGQALGCETISPFVQRQVELEDFAGAVAVWRAHCPSARGALIYDGNFAKAEVSQTRASMAWTFVGSAGVSVLLQPTDHPPAQALAVDGRIDRPRVFLRQLVPLTPGSYTVTWRARGDDGAPSRRIVAGLACIVASGPWSPVTNLSDGRQQAVLTYDGQCKAAWLSFALLPGSGAVRLEDIAIKPGGVPVPQP